MHAKYIHRDHRLYIHDVLDIHRIRQDLLSPLLDIHGIKEMRRRQDHHIHSLPLDCNTPFSEYVLSYIFGFSIVFFFNSLHVFIFV